MGAHGPRGGEVAVTMGRQLNGQPVLMVSAELAVVLLAQGFFQGDQLFVFGEPGREPGVAVGLRQDRPVPGRDRVRLLAAVFVGCRCRLRPVGFHIDGDDPLRAGFRL